MLKINVATSSNDEQVYLITTENAGQVPNGQYVIPATPAVTKYLLTHKRRKANDSLVTDLRNYGLRGSPYGSVDSFSTLVSTLLDINALGGRFGATATSRNARVDALIEKKAEILAAISAVLFQWGQPLPQEVGEELFSSFIEPGPTSEFTAQVQAEQSETQFPVQTARMTSPAYPHGPQIHIFTQEEIDQARREAQETLADIDPVQQVVQDITQDGHTVIIADEAWTMANGGSRIPLASPISAITNPRSSSHIPLVPPVVMLFTLTKAVDNPQDLSVFNAVQLAVVAPRSADDHVRQIVREHLNADNSPSGMIIDGRQDGSWARFRDVDGLIEKLANAGYSASVVEPVVAVYTNY